MMTGPIHYGICTISNCLVGFFSPTHTARAPPKTPPPPPESNLKYRFWLTQIPGVQPPLSNHFKYIASVICLSKLQHRCRGREQESKKLIRQQRERGKSSNNYLHWKMNATSRPCFLQSSEVFMVSVCSSIHVPSTLASTSLPSDSLTACSCPWP